MKTVLVIDDIEISTFIVRKLINQVSPETTVYECNDPVKGLEMISKINPDFIFLDLNMPLMDGWQFLDKMQKKDLDHKVVILTSSTSSDDHGESYNFPNVYSFLVKPLKPSDISTLLQTIPG
ncbi:response regulator [Pedobacter sp. P351]|uniref:response regulator n=1 Tax=Pedobacter superstes TaxID=3133441 RepID=UPI0030B03DCD